MATKKQQSFGNKMRKHISESTKAMQLLAEMNLSKMSERLIADIMKNKKKLSEAKAYQATNEVSATGKAAYLKEMNELLADITEKSWDMASAYTGIKAPIKFASNFEKLPKSVRDRIKKTNDLLVGSQVSDLEKNIFFTYDDAIFQDLPDKEIISKLEDSAEKFYTGASISAGSSKISAEYVNYATNAYYAVDEVADELEAFLYYNPDPKTAICIELAGKYFKPSDPNIDRYTAPNHYGCKSTWIPILKGQMPKDAVIIKLDPSKTAKKSVQFSCCCETENFLKETA